MTPSDPNQPEGLPSYPSAPSANDYGQTPQQPAYAPPREVMISFWCYVVAAAIVLIGGLFTIGLRQSALDTLRANNNTAHLTESQMQVTATAGIAIAVVISVIIAGLYLFFAFKLRSGRNWARIVLTVVAAINLLSLVSVARQGGSPISYIGALAAIAGCVLSYLPNSMAYFAAVKASRQQLR